jgi:hypothetical protein
MPQAQGPLDEPYLCIRQFVFSRLMTVWNGLRKGGGGLIAGAGGAWVRVGGNGLAGAGT